MPQPATTIEEQFRTLDNDPERRQFLRRAAACAELVSPGMLPLRDVDAKEAGNTNGDKLPEPFQSLGSLAATVTTGVITTDLFPPGGLWIMQEVSPELRYAPDVNREWLANRQWRLYMQTLMMLSILQSPGIRKGSKGYRHSLGFFAQMNASMRQCVVLGDTKKQLTDDYRVKVFRPDQYVNVRDACGDLVCEIVREYIDPLSLTEEQFAKSDIKMADMQEKHYAQRMMPLFTSCEWQHRAGTWVIRQEVNKKVVAESEDAVSPYMSTPFQLLVGESYGRGLIEQNRGDLKSLDELCQRLMEAAAQASKMVPCIDNNSDVMETDLQKPTGIPIRARVQDGKVLDLALLTTGKIQDFMFVANQIDRLRQSLGRALFLESETQPRGDRVTATQSSIISDENQGARGGWYASLSDAEHMPLYQRLRYQLVRDKIIPPDTTGAVKVQTLTGFAALSRRRQSQKLLNIATVATQLGPEAMAQLDIGSLFEAMLRYENVDEPSVVKSKAEVQQAQAQQTQQQLALTAGEKAIDVMGNIAEQQAAAQAKAA